jgi:hypothetical protein
MTPTVDEPSLQTTMPPEHSILLIVSFTTAMKPEHFIGEGDEAWRIETQESKVE